MKCWYCGMMTMFPDERMGKGWYQCNKCKATEGRPLPKLSKSFPAARLLKHEELAKRNDKRNR